MVDIATFKAQAVIIADAMNIMFADPETRSPLHPLRQMNNLFVTGVKGQSFISNLGYIDAAYEGRYPSGKVEPNQTVLTPNTVAPSAIILKADGTFNDPAILELSGDFTAGSTSDVVMTTDINPGTGAIVPAQVFNLSVQGWAARWSDFMRGATNITSTSKGNKIFVKPGGAATTINLSALIVT